MFKWVRFNNLDLLYHCHFQINVREAVLISIAYTQFYEILNIHYDFVDKGQQSLKN